ncbi:MBL fold metallo-hydrolase [Pseudoxanthomonas kalamensis DSM 18571]|uniref:MBL fold metallo-hydrolase n=1 Tax=Pseudoxanthomonas kalamensis TaxID=289483 RepID=UPI001390C4EE|nr:MBL fold metallo-hydrolase [Pseudoxanthomonas kalamensis]KAF1711972.1 MBL fold metallo-hydrolase [Pseudoxanthomonas kalamensis DSM 18571]
MPGHGIHVVDTGFHRPRFDAAYLLVENGRGAFIDCGTNHSVPLLLQALDKAGLQPSEVDWLILTHVHLDHAGGAGLLMQQLPNATLVVHPRGARHMIDPSKLIAGATAVYGEAEVQRSYGTLQPVPEARVRVAADGERIDLAGRELLCVDTPGHARHHHCIWDARSRCWFTGDTFGLSYRELDTARGPFVLPTTTPVQFEPEALKDSIDRLLSRSPEGMYLTHYGRIGASAEEVRGFAAALCEQIDAMVAIARDCAGREGRHAAITAALAELYLSRVRRHGVTLDDARVREVLGSDIELNAQGLEVWLDRAAA